MIAVDSPPKQVFIYPAQVPQTPLPLVEKIPGTTPGLLHSNPALTCARESAVLGPRALYRRADVKVSVMVQN